jgi:nickel transport protein
MARRVVFLALLGGVAALMAPVARAHGIQSTLDYLPSAGGGKLELESHFSSGDPARDATVRLLPPDGGEAIAIGRTGPDGRLTFTLPPGARNDWEIQVDAGPGHRDYLSPDDAGRLPAPGGFTGEAAAPVRRLHRWSGPLPWALTGLALIGGLGLSARRGKRS